MINKEDYSGRRQIELAPGVYRIELSAPGYYDQSENITIARGHTLHKKYVLSQKTGKLNFSVTPLQAKAGLKRDGKIVKQWQGAIYLKNLPVGEYELEISATNYSTQTRTLTITENRITSLDVVLTKSTSSKTQDLSFMGKIKRFFVKNTKEIEMVYVPGGTFKMGDDAYGDSGEIPVHTVTVNSFWICKYEVTQAKYQEIMGTNPSHFKGDNRPVEQVSWFDAVQFCNKLSEREGLEPCYTINGREVTCDFSKNGYRLPTEAEWEYAARGGRKSRHYQYAGSNDVDAVAWYWNNAGKKTHPMGQKRPNELGIYDMSGNVWEWCWDWYSSSYYSSSPQKNPRGPYSGSFRVLRGGSLLDFARDVRVAKRGGNTPSYSYSDLGFRLVRKR